jgi:hypothetical protein
VCLREDGEEFDILSWRRRAVRSGHGLVFRSTVRDAAVSHEFEYAHLLASAYAMW